MTGLEMTIALAVVSAAAAVGKLMLRNQARREQAREESRRDHVWHLPPDSLIVDLGKNGMVIEVGGRGSGRQERPDGAR